MKKSIIALAVMAVMCGCRGNIYNDLPATGNDRTIVPVQLREGGNTLLLTDFLPEWDGADSVTSKELAVKPLAEDWSEFEITAPQGAFVATLEAWQQGAPISIVAYGGQRRDDSRIFSTGYMLNMVVLEPTIEVKDVVAMWQNCRLPDDNILRNESNIEILIPGDAKSAERSCLRVFAVGEDVRFNDIRIPLQYGKVVSDAKQLTRHDRESQVLYSLMIDRFFDGKAENNQPLNSPDVLPQADYQGGDLVGITQKIKDGFFSDLGISTIWISPITQNPRDAWGLNENPRTKFSGYHGYWPIYTTVVDDRFGTEEELRELLATAHEKGMNVVLDYVANHLHINSPVLQAHPDWVTPLMLPDGRKNLSLWDEQRLTTWFDEHIPTLDLERQEVVEPMTDSAMYWVKNFDFDGFRHDACKHIPLNYWRMLTKKMRQQLPDRQLWQIGETYGSPELIGSYVRSGMIDAQFDFNVYHTSLDVLTRDHSVRRLASVVEESLSAYGDHHTMGNITGNHDKGRLISLAGGTLHPDEDHKAAGWLREIGVGDKVGYKKLALINALNMTIPGVPCIYQGDEYGEPGGNDPDNRRMMRFDGYNEDEQAQLDVTRRLIELRRKTMPLLYGDMMTLALTDNLWVYMRVYMGEWSVVILNTGGEEQSIECELPACINLEQPLTAHFGNEFGLLSDGKLSLKVAPYGFEILTKNIQ
ncbi:MAG: alpha-amlyase [Rikenellaceae bacterium]|nr:alpha-amlyase [Rikenellaceae bacterium]